jgi:predicted phage gp36 major capsid-like protein
VRKNPPKARTRVRKAAAAKTARKKAARVASTPGQATPCEEPTPEDEAAFTETVIQTGEAAHLDEQGKLPAGATLKIVEDKAGHVKVVRRRYSIA